MRDTDAAKSRKYYDERVVHEGTGSISVSDSAVGRRFCGRSSASAFHHLACGTTSPRFTRAQYPIDSPVTREIQ
jgi:hypothetical protein